MVHYEPEETNANEQLSSPEFVRTKGLVQDLNIWYHILRVCVGIACRPESFFVVVVIFI
jgi:hypothetical protein